MKNKKLQELTKLFHKEIPELVRLEFGCKVFYYFDKKLGYKTIGKILLVDKMEGTFSIGGKHRIDLRIPKENITKIIGKDITFDYILIILDKKKYKYSSNKIDELLDLVEIWTPKTPLHIQKPEVWDLLHTILITK
jgi:hypothetical protein